MTLSRVLEGVSVIKMFQTLYGKMVVTHEVEIRGIQYDSRKVGRDEMFVAIKGGTTDGHKFIDRAVGGGANVVVVEDDNAIPDSYFMHAGVVKIVVGNSRKALAQMSANLFGHPSEKLKLVGVTGTNGKTSTTYLIKSIFEANGEKVGLIGTIEYKIGEEVIPSTHTTPESLELNQLLATMVLQGCNSAVMEVSSHSLALYRVYGLKFVAAVFTNLTQDHLDFHGTMEDYFCAKKTLFNSLSDNSVAITNRDDPYGMKAVADTKAPVVTYGIENADVHASNVNLSLKGTSFTIVYKGSSSPVESMLIGGFNVKNILAAFTTGISLGVEKEKIAEGIRNLRAVPGRFQQFTSPEGWIAIVDYAHTHDALENCLRTIREIVPAEQRGRIITVFGAGGNRDKGKRPLMGRVATEYSDIIIITSDNPRHEDPLQIIEEIKKGVLPGKSVIIEPDRHKAIAVALEMARSGDIVFFAGKGHEDYQIIGDEKIHFDDREEVETYIRNKR